MLNATVNLSIGGMPILMGMLISSQDTLEMGYALTNRVFVVVAFLTFIFSLAFRCLRTPEARCLDSRLTINEFVAL